MTVTLFIYLVVCAAIFALLEIQIEGKYGWAEKLPTWRIKNPFRKIVNWPYIDGYHTWLWILMIFLFHLQYFFGVQISFKNEIVVIESLLIFLFSEDFLWFVLNPNWGLKKYFIEEVPWQQGKLFSIPKAVLSSLLILTILEFVKYYFFREILWVKL